MSRPGVRRNLKIRNTCDNITTTIWGKQKLLKYKCFIILKLALQIFNSD